MANKGLVIGIVSVAVLAIGTTAYILISKSNKKKEAQRKLLESKLTSDQKKQYEKIPSTQKGAWLNSALNIIQTGADIYKQYVTPPKENLVPANTLGDPTPNMVKTQGYKEVVI